MSTLREAVTIKTATGELEAELYVGLDSLPEIQVTGGGYHERGVYRVVSFPHAWSLSSPTCGPLFTAWQEIEAIRERLRAAEREERKGGN